MSESCNHSCSSATNCCKLYQLQCKAAQLHRTTWLTVSSRISWDRSKHRSTAYMIKCGHINDGINDLRSTELLKPSYSSTSNKIPLIKQMFLSAPACLTHWLSGCGAVSFNTMGLPLLFQKNTSNQMMIRACGRLRECRWRPQKCCHKHEGIFVHSKVQTEHVKHWM